VTLPLSASGGAFRAYPGKVVFVRSGQIFVGDNADLTGAINIATGANPSVSPDGTTVAYDSGGQVRTVSITGTGDAPLAGAAGSQPAWGLSGGKVFFITPTGAIASVPYPAGGLPTQFTNAPATGNKDVTASPDGNTVAFANNSLTPTYQIYTTDSDGTTGTATRFTNSSGNDTNPSFNPNGTPIVYASDRTGKNQLWTASFPGGSSEQQHLSDANNDSSPAFSPDGKLILFSSDVAGLQTVRFFTPHTVVTIPGTAAGDTLPDWQDAPPVNTSAPVISGTPAPGQTLTTSNGTWDGFPNLAFKYQWQRTPSGGSTWTDIPGATTSQYVVQATDLGFDIRVEVIATNVAGDSVPAPSAPAGTTIGAPKNLTPPVVTGNYTANPGGFLSATAGTWSGLTPITYTYQWLRCYGQTDGHCAPITGATGSFYTPNGDDINTQLNVGVVAKNSAGTGFASSAPTPYITGDPPRNHVSPSISGGIHVGETLATTDGVWFGPTPLTFTYQWRLCRPAGDDCNSIPSATGKSYTIQPQDYGSTIRMMIRARNGAGFAYGISNHTFPILHKTLFGPSTTSPPTLAGPARIGAILVATGGTWSGEVPITYTYAWERCDATGGTCVTIPRQKAKTYRVGPKDIGSTIRFKVTAINAINTGIAFSSTTDAILGAKKKPKGRRLIGTARADYLPGGAGNDRILGNGGADTILGGAGDDFLDGGDGNDVMNGGPGSDRILGGVGSDTIHADDGERDTVDCGTGSDRVYVDALDIVKNCEVVTNVAPTPPPPPTK
jgi:hypothetical protein